MIQLALIFLAMYCWCLHTALSLIHVIIASVYIPDEQIQSEKGRTQNILTDKPTPNGKKIQGASAIENPPMEMSVKEVNRLAQMEHQREVRISAVEKGGQRQRRQKYTNVIRKKAGLKLQQGLAEECCQSMDEVPANTGSLPASPEDANSKLNDTTLFIHKKALGMKSSKSGVQLHFSIFSAESLNCKISSDWKMISNHYVLPLKISQLSPPMVPEVVLSPTTMNLIVRPKVFQPTLPLALNLGLIAPMIADGSSEPQFVFPISPPVVLDLGSIGPAPELEHSTLQLSPVLPKVVLPPTSLDLIVGPKDFQPTLLLALNLGLTAPMIADGSPEPQFVFPISPPVVLDLDSINSAPQLEHSTVQLFPALPKVVLPPTSMDLIVQPKDFQPTLPLALNLGLTAPMIADGSPEPQFVFPNPHPVISDLGSIHSVPQLEHPTFQGSPALPSDCLQTKRAQQVFCRDLVLRPKLVTTSPYTPLPRTRTDLILRPKFHSPFWTCVPSVSSSIHSAEYPAPPPDSTDPVSPVIAAAESPSPPLSSPPIDLTIRKTVSNIKRDSSTQVMPAKVAILDKVGVKSKGANKAAKALSNIWKRGSKSRGWTKAKEKIEKSLQRTGDRLDAIRLRREKI